MEKTVNICVNTNLEELAYSVAVDCDYKECLNFIKNIDEQNENWEFTEMILEYCLKQVSQETDYDINEILSKKSKEYIVKLSEIIKNENE